MNAPALKMPPLPVTVRVPVTGHTDLLTSGRVAAGLVSKRARFVRVQALLQTRSGASRALGPARTMWLRAGRLRNITLPLDRHGRAALAKCPVANLALAVNGAHYRTRTVIRRLRLDPPDCARFFGPRALWNTSLAESAPLDPDSAAITGRMLRDLNAAWNSSKPPWINTTEYTPPVYTAGHAQRTVPVKLDVPHNEAPQLASAFAQVPLPDYARPAAGTDSELVVSQPATDTLWEFWQLHHASDGWHARWGGKLEHVSSGPGYFGAPRADWGATATSLPLVGGLITPRELQSGQIQHALAIAAPNTRMNQFALPAQRTDGDSTDTQSVPEGAHFRLDPKLDIASLELAPPIRAMAVAAQRYGIVVRDRSDAFAFYAQNAGTMPANPYPSIFGGKDPSELLKTFPWSHLQLLKMQLGRMPDQGPPPIECLLGGCP